MAARKTAPNSRPLSPHLQVYRPQITSFLSIIHRLTGVALTAGALLFSYWIISTSYGESAFNTAQSLLGSWFGQFVMFGFTFAIFYHLCNGIRHMAWDAGRGYDMPTLRKSGWFVVIISLSLTALTWIAAYTQTGGA